MTEAILALLNFFLICIAAIYIITRSRTVVSRALKHPKPITGIIFCIVLFSIPVILTTRYGLSLLEVKTNLRTTIVFFSAIIGGPICSLAVSIIGAVYRYSLGGWTHLACAAATLGAGLAASIIAYRTKIHPGSLNWKNISLWTGLVFIWDSIHVFVFIPLLGGRPLDETLLLIRDTIFLPQVLTNTLAMAAVTLLVMDLITRDARIVAVEQKKWLEKTLAMAHELEMKVEDRTRELAEMNEKLYELSIKDALTSLFNRQYLNKVIEEENERLEKGSYRYYSVLCVDLDNLKPFNDKYGHQAGDIILQEFARILKLLIGDQGIIFRTGGDEFTILLPGMDEDTAVQLAQTILVYMDRTQTFSEKIMPHSIESIHNIQKTSCSIGIKTTTPEEQIDLDSMLYHADQALLRAKYRGKQRYCLAKTRVAQ